MNATQTAEKLSRPRTRLEIENDILSRAGYDADGFKNVSVAEMWEHAFDLRKPKLINMTVLWRALNGCDEVYIKEHRTPRQEVLIARLEGAPPVTVPRVCAVLTHNTLQSVIVATMKQIGPEPAEFDEAPDYKRALLQALSSDPETQHNALSLVLVLNGGYLEKMGYTRERMQREATLRRDKL